MHGHEKTLLPHLKSEKAEKEISQVLCGTNMRQPHLVTRKGLHRVGLRRKDIGYATVIHTESIFSIILD